jgi:hypothetical protein
MNDSKEGSISSLLDHPVERIERLPHVGQCRRIGVGERLRHLFEVGPGHLLAEPLDEVLEMLTRLGRDEFVTLEATCRPGRSGEDQAASAVPRRLRR